MQKTLALLDEAKKKAAITSDYALAKHLGVSRQLMSNWYNMRELPGTLSAIKLAETLGRPPVEVIAEIEIERATRQNKPELAEQWRQILNKAATGFMGLFLTGSILFAPDPVNASSISPMKTGDIDAGQHCILCQPKGEGRRRRRNRRRSGAIATIARTLYGISALH